MYYQQSVFTSIYNCWCQRSSWMNWRIFVLDNTIVPASPIFIFREYNVPWRYLKNFSYFSVAWISKKKILYQYLIHIHSRNYDTKINSYLYVCTRWNILNLFYRNTSNNLSIRIYDTGWNIWNIFVCSINWR